jgi:thymus-specific serine protease
MKAALVLAVLALVGLSAAQIITRSVDLRIDHFNPIDRRSFDARYFHNPQHFLPGGPIFIYVSGGFEVYDEFLSRGAVFEIAEDTRGHLFSLEHRFYGQSLPTEDTSVENLRFLTIHQAIADLAQFINFIRNNYYGASTSRVILWGRGYGGALAVWARQKYPNVVDGVWASSAPINAVLEFNQFMPNAFHTIEQIGGPECGEVMNGAFRIIEDAVRRRNTTFVEQRLRLCSPIDLDIEEDIARLYYGIAADIGYSFVSNSRYPDIDEKCRIMSGADTPENLPENDLDAFARWFVDDYNRNLECLEYNNTAVLARYQQTAWNTVSTIAGRRQNFWLQCTQLGQFAVANEGERHPFGWRFDIEFFRRWCADAFDQEL